MNLQEIEKKASIGLVKIQWLSGNQLKLIAAMTMLLQHSFIALTHGSGPFEIFFYTKSRWDLIRKLQVQVGHPHE